MTFAFVVLYLVVAEKFPELEPSVLPVVETLVLHHDAVKVLVEAGLVVALDIEELSVLHHILSVMKLWQL